MRGIPVAMMAALALVPLATAPAHAGWSASPTPVRLTSSAIPVMASASDGAFGAYVAWQEESSPGLGVLRMQHVLHTGDLDPAWPADGAVACGTVSSRAEIGLIADPAGGGGNVLDARLGPAGTAPAGWSPLVRAMATTPDFNYSSGIVRSADGGVFCVWATWSSDSTALPHGFYAKRLLSTGALAPGWPSEGLALADFHPWALHSAMDQVVAATSDAAGGFYALLLDPLGDPNHEWLTTTIQRRQADGSASPAWPAAGRRLDDTFGALLDGVPPRLVSDGTGGVVSALPGYWTDAPVGSLLRGYDPNGAATLIAGRGWGSAFEVVGDPVSGVHSASGFSCWAAGPFGTSTPSNVRFESATPIETKQPASARYEGPDYPGCVYGDVAIAPTGDGGSISFFCRTSGTTGIYAVKMNRAGVVTGIEAAAPLSLKIARARFVEGVGARIGYTMPGAGGGRLALFDLGGRRVSDAPLAATAAAEVTLDGTRDLDPGVYFVRLSRGPRFAVAKLFVTR